jgi:hypothetical protein
MQQLSALTNHLALRLFHNIRSAITIHVIICLSHPAPNPFCNGPSDHMRFCNSPCNDHMCMSLITSDLDKTSALTQES